MLILLTSCGEIKIGIDEDTLDSIEDILSSGDDCSQATTEGKNHGGKKIMYACSEDSSDTETETNDIEVDSSGRYFVGSYHLYTHTSCNKYYTFPSNVRLYSRNNQVDFEGVNDQVLWTAEVYQDNTFDFTTQYLDELGQGNDFSCTCYIKAGSYYLAETLNCTCSPPSCSLIYAEK